MTNHSKKQLKIAVIGYKLAEGGLERVFGNTTIMLHKYGVEVHTIVLEDAIEYDFGGKLIVFGKFSRFLKYFKLRNYLKKEKFDFIIDFRHRINPKMEWLFLNFIYKNTKTIYTVHSSRLQTYLTASNYITKHIFQKVDKVVCVSNFIKHKIKDEYQFNSVTVIPNTVHIQQAFDTKKLPFDYCIAVGRLVALKQFDKLIESYSKSNLPSKNIHLVILGTGEEQSKLEQLVTNLQMNDFVHLLGFKEDVFDYISNAKFLVLSSKYEGFPMTILEALSLGTPVVSFDCESGPNEMIVNNQNGILVENQNFNELTHKMNIFVEDEILSQNCKKNAVSSVAKFQSNVIVKQWLQILNNGN
ncbi:glycosyltransferase [Flavobacterium sp.]|uniref:glycosyltransferase n=1 Tax=Flavobacterium sp. TaxID=239 RepID=UPI0040476390